jgi:hypothetical protein
VAIRQKGKQVLFLKFFSHMKNVGVKIELNFMSHRTFIIFKLIDLWHNEVRALVLRIAELV